MIVAKTEMGNMPESCRECILGDYTTECWADIFRFCQVAGRALPHNYTCARPGWCPLKEIDDELMRG